MKKTNNVAAAGLLVILAILLFFGPSSNIKIIGFFSGVLTVTSIFMFIFQPLEDNRLVKLFLLFLVIVNLLLDSHYKEVKKAKSPKEKTSVRYT